ncbi:MAG: FAD-dependent oxidoreductase [Candidatus Woesearchaeota archaeon]
MRIAIVGGGFCGAKCAKILEKNLKDAEILLFDKKDYFYYTPSIHKIITKKDYDKKIMILYSKCFNKVEVIIEPIQKITKRKVITNSDEYSFDYLVLSTGNISPIFLQNKQNIYILKTVDDAYLLHDKLQNAESIAIVGGGLTGTEIAGELCTKTKKQITLFHPQDRLLERQPEKVSEKARKFLKKRKVMIFFGHKVIENNNGEIKTDKGFVMKPDLIIWTAGIASDVSYLGEDFKQNLNERNYLVVNDFLHLEDSKNIFVGGDLNAIKEEKTAQTAEKHGKLIAHNIIAYINNKEGKRWIPKSWPMAISLGDYYSIFVKNRIILSGLIPALMKKAIEVVVIHRYKKNFEWFFDLLP